MMFFGRNMEPRTALRAMSLAMISWLALSSLAIGQNAPQADDSDAGDYGVRFTPGMARSLAGIYTRQMLKNRYELPEEKIAEAQELVARRFMQLAHKIDQPGRELLERFVEEQLTYNAEHRGGGGFMPPTFGKEFADRVLPILPEVRDMVRGVSQDVRPMLPMKQQLKMAGDMMAFKTATDGFEETMKKWSSGEITEYKDPFNPRREERKKKDEQGQTERLKGARSSAQNEADKSRAKRWEGYIEKFKELYELDTAQTSTAESILREYTEREQRLIAEPGWRDRIYRGQLWTNMQWEIENAWNHPAKWLIEDNLATAREPLEDLDEQFKARLESIPTSSQRRAAEQRVEALLKEKGLQLPEVKQ